jgi:hypothetical protein
MLRELEIRRKETKLTRVITKRDFYGEREGVTPENSITIKYC